MSNSIFVVDDEVVNPPDRPQTFKFNPNLIEGLRTAVRNNQQQLAVQYLAFIVDVLDEQLRDEPTPKAQEAKPELRKNAGRPKTRSAADDEVGVFEGAETA